MKSEEIKNIVKESYSKIAKNESSCCTCSCKKNEQEKSANKIFQKMIELKIFHDRAKNKKLSLANEFKQKKECLRTKEKN